jgi:hypothetical protein
MESPFLNSRLKLRSKISKTFFVKNNCLLKATQQHSGKNGVMIDRNHRRSLTGSITTINTHASENIYEGVFELIWQKI